MVLNNPLDSNISTFMINTLDFAFRGILRTQPNIYDGAFFVKMDNSF